MFKTLLVKLGFRKWRYLGSAYKPSYRVDTYESELTGEREYKYTSYRKGYWI